MCVCVCVRERERERWIDGVCELGGSEDERGYFVWSVVF